jgi:hypothetical protein
MANETLTFRPSKGNKKIIADLKKLANQDNRNLNNYVETVFINHIKSASKNNKK